MKFKITVTLVLVIWVTGAKINGETRCDPFEYFFNKNYGGASGNSAGTTLELCKLECLHSATCYAIDYNPNGNPRCWIHSNPSVLTANLNYHSGATHLRRNTSCTAGFCKIWGRHDDLNFRGGTGYAAGTTVELCKQKCLDEATTCYAIDFNPNPRSGTKCWIHTNKDALTGELYIYEGNTFFVRHLGCSELTCVDSWEAHSSSLYYGGIHNSAATTLNSCKQQCISYVPYCYAIDFNPSTSKCFIHTNSAVKTASLSYSPQVNHYRRSERCPSPPEVCEDRWDVSLDSHANGGIFLADGYSYKLCQKECINYSPYCYAFDYNPFSQTYCSVHTDPAVLTATLYSEYGNSHNKRRKECKDVQCPASDIKKPEHGRVIYSGWNSGWKTSNNLCEAVYTDFVLLRNPKARLLKCDGMNIGNTVSYVCDEGFTLTGSSERRCLVDGTWSGSEPTCQ